MAGGKVSRGSHFVRVLARSITANARASRGRVSVTDVSVENQKASDLGVQVAIESVKVLDDKVKDDGGLIAVSKNNEVRCFECNDLLEPDDNMVCGFCEDYVSFESDSNCDEVYTDEDDCVSSNTVVEVVSPLKCEPKDELVPDAVISNNFIKTKV